MVLIGGDFFRLAGAFLGLVFSSTSLHAHSLSAINSSFSLAFSVRSSLIVTDLERAVCVRSLCVVPMRRRGMQINGPERLFRSLSWASNEILAHCFVCVCVCTVIEWTH